MKLQFAIVTILGVIVAGALLTRALAAFVPGAVVTSWYRTPWRNSDVGGAAGSFHLIGWAVDLWPANGPVQTVAGRLFPFVLNEGDHIHAGLVR